MEKVMFDFEKLAVYEKARDLNVDLLELMNRYGSDPVANDQLRRAALSVMLNIAEGSGRRSRADKRRFHVMARGSLFECVAILDFLLVAHKIDVEERSSFYMRAEELSKMLFAMIRKLE